MNCQETRELIEDALDKRLTGGVKRKFDLHLTHCRDCRRFYEAEQAEHARWFRAMNDTAAEPPHPLPTDFADRLVAAVLAKGTAHTSFIRRFRIPRWLKRAACFALLLSGVAFAATVVVDAVMEKEDNSEVTVGRVAPNVSEAIEETEESTALAASAALSAAPYAPEVALDPSADHKVLTTDCQLPTRKGETTMNKGRAATAVLSAAIVATAVPAFSAALTDGTSSREQTIDLVARDRTHADAGFDMFLARDRDIKEGTLAKFRSDVPRGTIMVLR